MFGRASAPHLGQFVPTPELEFGGEVEARLRVSREPGLQPLPPLGPAQSAHILPGIDHSFIGGSHDQTRDTSRAMLAL